MVTQAATLVNLPDLEAAIAAAQRERIDTTDAVQVAMLCYLTLPYLTLPCLVLSYRNPDIPLMYS